MEGARVYVPDVADAWQKATVVAALGGGCYRVQLEPWECAAPSGPTSASGSAAAETTEVDASKLEGGALPFQNAGMPATGFPNMTVLDHLHEAALLHNLRVRFFAGACPYTYTADIVIAVNPYKWFPHLYAEERRKEYLVFDRVKLPPHVYSASSAAYQGLRETRKDQSILVSGESGAGKTETVKILMGHLALIASSDDSLHIQRIVESNPLLESFGNAQTVRNDNSSRFGKFIELQLNGEYRLVGSKCRTYLLEKSRVVGQDAGERNYHIFYQMLAGGADARASFGLARSSLTRDTMRYTCMGSSKTDVIEGMTDAERFKSTIDALALVGIEGDLLRCLLRGLGGILLLGQIDFPGASSGAESQDEVASFSQATAEDSAEAVAALEVDLRAFEQALTTRSIKTRGEVISKPLTPSGALSTRDALAKELYARLFDWLVMRICSATAAPSEGSQHFVGLLDIFGFESFVINRFEQLCINYANEKLQQKFTLDVFKAVQQEYADEGIPWDRIEFKDNAPLLALIESKLGIIALLNEEGVRPKGSDESFVSKLGTVHKTDPAFSTPKLGKQKELQFSIRHYAGLVTYTATGWLERNKDTISDDVKNMLRGSSNQLIAEVFAEPSEENASGTDGKAKGSANTLATKFKASLAQLMETIGQTSTQYVRCIKPNKKKTPSEMDNTMVIEQLRCAGVIEAIRISRAGFPARMPLEEFVKRFNALARSAAGIGLGRGSILARGGASLDSALAIAVGNVKTDTVKSVACRAFLAVLVPLGEQLYEVGHTRVYFKMGVLESLEERRTLVQQAAATEVARHMRGRQARQRFVATRIATLRLQATARMLSKCVAYLALRAAVVFCQAMRRGILARRRVTALRRTRCATRIQACQRRRIAMGDLARTRKAVVRLQASARRRSCRSRYLIDLAESKEQAKLENQVLALQAKLVAQENLARAASVVEPPAELLDALQALKAENVKLRADNERQRAEITDLRRENQQLRASQVTRSDQLSSLLRAKTKKAAATSAGQSSENAYTPARGQPWNLGTSPETSPSSTRRLTFESYSPPPESDAAFGNGRAFRFYEPLFPDFWEDVPCEVLPHMKTGSEVHIKFGPNILLVEESKGFLLWRHWMPEARSYQRSMAFYFERRTVGGVEPSHQVVSGDDCSLGGTFALRSALTLKYVVVGSMLERYAMKVTSTRPEDATVFTFMPLPELCGQDAEAESGSGAGYMLAIKVAGENKALRLRGDGTVHMAAISDVESDSCHERMAASIEHLLPRDSYTLAIAQQPIGLVLNKDPPLRIMGFRAVSRDPSMPLGPGPAECTGRAHTGDVLTSVNGQDVGGIPCGDVIAMITCKVPVSIGFSVPYSPDGVKVAAPPALQRQPLPRKRSSLLATFTGKRSSKAVDKALGAAKELHTKLTREATIDI